MSKARNMIIDGYKKGTQLQMDEWGLFYIFNGRNPIDGCNIESYNVLEAKSIKNIVSTVGRGVIGASLFGIGGSTAALTGKENIVYTIYVVWRKTKWNSINETSVFELDSSFYQTFVMKCTNSPEMNDKLNKTLIPDKYNYNYRKWCEHNNIELIVGKPRNEIFVDALFNNPETNPILDCCRNINPEWEEYMKQQEQANQSQQPQTVTNNTSDIKSKLQQLKSMYEEDLITEEEYQCKKKELLSKM